VYVVWEVSGGWMGQKTKKQKNKYKTKKTKKGYGQGGLLI
jgi:hypothetical protein